MNPLGIDPNLISWHLGDFHLQVRWYSVMYITGYIVGSYLLGRLAARKFLPLSKVAIDQYVINLIIGMIIGARVTYCFIYDFPALVKNPFSLFEVWKGGLSFHGAVIGMVLATWKISKKFHVPFFVISDSMALAGTPGLLFGRIGNFINGELFGRVTDVSWGVIFPEGGPLPRHPSMLYEGVMEGIVLSLVLWFLLKKVKYYGYIGAAFLAGYGFFRFIVEFFREPDPQMGYVLFDFFTTGQILCFLMLIPAFIVYRLANHYKIKIPYTPNS
ncbi:MAG: prolipoprotein diacylglyceryl transferase [Bacteriovoracaceae bacterium]|nr:prolipoprotein diacylglyceryl transferase [Bacteriovoracaceae bacterium]